jgi:hypothetical protein
VGLCSTSGFKALCTTNLPEPTIADGSTVMDVVTRTFTGASASITSLAFAPDFLWFKRRNDAASHSLFDSVRGVSGRLLSNGTNAEITVTDALTSFDSNGFTLGVDSGSISVNGPSSGTGVVWAWDAGTSTVTNTQGSITSSVRANASAGFSVVTYTGTNSAATVGHGLGVAPQMVIAKSRTVSNTSWVVYHTSLGGTNKVIVLNSTDAPQTITDYWGSAAPTSTVFGVANGTFDNNNGNLVAYCFAPVAGYSAMGSFTSGSSPFVFTGFKPRFILAKGTGSGRIWNIYDSARDPYNAAGKILKAENSGAEIDSPPRVDFLSNGFKIRSSSGAEPNVSDTYIYYAVAENPFQSSRAR